MAALGVRTQAPKMTLAAGPAAAPQEDEVLRQQVGEHGAQNWSHIAEALEGRNGKSCRLRCAARQAQRTRPPARSAAQRLAPRRRRLGFPSTMLC
jgi:hypothetical protein